MKSEPNNLSKHFDCAANCVYLLTIRRTRANRAEALEFRDYFEMLRVAAGCEILVVDGSPPSVFAAHAEIWRGVCRHEKVDPRYKFLNGKVNGIHTGIALAAHERVILADDDIRYTAANVRRMCELLSDFDMVRPQNYLSPLPVWALSETARMLLNRAFLPEGDYTGTLGVRRDPMRRVGHYDGDVLFDNEEIVRHFRLKNADVKAARDFFILKRPSTLRKWLEQRPRQAYEDFVMPAKTALFLLLPVILLILLIFISAKAALVFFAFAAVTAIIFAACGLGDGAPNFIPVWSIFFAPVWIVERCFSTYWAFYWYFTRGGYPFGDRVLSKGTGDAWIAGGKNPNTIKK